MNKIGLVAGVGRLPVEFARAASGMGFVVVAIAVVDGVDAELENTCDTYYRVNPGELDKLITLLKEENIKQITMIGKVTKELLFAGTEVLDVRMQMMLKNLENFNDDAIMLGILKELAIEGITVLDQTELIKRLLVRPGILTKRQPSEKEMEDIKYGFDMAKEIGRLDIGQTVVVKDKAIMAVEAIEGTDECIKRGGILGRGGITVAKTAKPKQDIRFDMPSVGPDTLNVMIEAKATALVLEAGRTIIIDEKRVIEMADDHEITIIAM
ncbi:UDP-2,3-diacylglucosamine diphosphatase LpxI [Selenomonadales bacterium OttesenSCG-928-I06]|nr:UDP-2,3-diacylglucosamine diphosphatase LpxI [Selenomonadales bacterium OttesenSCG-928-I06]